MTPQQFAAIASLLDVRPSYKMVADAVLVEGETLANACEKAARYDRAFSGRTATAVVEKVRQAHAAIINAYAQEA